MRLSSKPWLVLFSAFGIHLLLGTVYAWSFFQTLLGEETGWSNTQIIWAFSLTIFFLGVAAAWGGLNLDKLGPSKLTLLGGLLYALGYLITAIALYYQWLWLLYLGFGGISGIGLGLAYVTPVATVAKWFTIYQGLATGFVVMGFGLGALVMSKIIAPLLLYYFSYDLPLTFLAIGVLFLCIIPFLALFLTNPQKNSQNLESSVSASSLYSRLTILLQPSFFLLWLMFFINIVAGMVFIAFQAPLLHDLLLNKTADLSQQELISLGATLIAVSSICNGLGRFTWAGISDRLGRIFTFRLLFIGQIIVFLALITTESPLLFSLFVSFILLCYGGGFGLMPALIKERVGSQDMAFVYGAILTAWSMGGIVGPQLVAYLKDYHSILVGLLTYIIASVLLTIGLLLSFLLPKTPTIIH